MKSVHLILAASIVCFSSEGNKVVFKGDTISFSESIGDAAGKKRIRFKSDTLRHNPFNHSLMYDSSTLKIFEIEGPMTPRDSIESRDMGVLSAVWGVKDAKENRYLNIADLKKIGNKKIDAETIRKWIIYGKMVKSDVKFREFVNELREAKIVSTPLKKGFATSELEEVQGFRKISMTIMIDDKFIKFSYLISPENEVMLLKKETLIEVYSPNLKTLPEMRSFLTLENPGDSTAYKTSRKYAEIIRKYDYELFN